MFSKTRFTIFLLAITALGFGCAGRQFYRATDSFGGIVDEAVKAFTDYEVLKAKGAGVTTPEGIKSWVEGQAEWKAFARLRENYNNAYTAWCEMNAAAAVSPSTNSSAAISAPRFKQAAINAAAELTAFVAQFLPQIKTVKI
jgi:hypothetical protein